MRLKLVCACLLLVSFATLASALEGTSGDETQRSEEEIRGILHEYTQFTDLDKVLGRDASPQDVVMAGFLLAHRKHDYDGDKKVGIHGYLPDATEEMREKDELEPLFIALRESWRSPTRGTREHLQEFVLSLGLNGENMGITELINTYDVFMTKRKSRSEEDNQRHLKKLVEEAKAQRAKQLRAEREAALEKEKLEPLNDVNELPEEKDWFLGDDIRCSRCERVAEELFHSIVGADDGTAVGHGDRKFPYSLRSEWEREEMFEDVCEHAFVHFGISEHTVDADGKGNSRTVKSFVRLDKQVDPHARPDGITERMNGVCNELIGEHADEMVSMLGLMPKSSSKKRKSVSKGWTQDERAHHLTTFVDKMCMVHTRSCQDGEREYGDHAAPLPPPGPLPGSPEARQQAHDRRKKRKQRKRKQRKRKQKRKRKPKDDDEEDLFHEEL